MHALLRLVTRDLVVRVVSISTNQMVEVLMAEVIRNSFHIVDQLGKLYRLLIVDQQVLVFKVARL